MILMCSHSWDLKVNFLHVHALNVFMNIIYFSLYPAYDTCPSNVSHALINLVERILAET